MDETTEKDTGGITAASAAGSNPAQESQKSEGLGAAASAAAPSSSPIFEKERQDIERILKEVKLPERNTATIPGEKPVAKAPEKVFDTALGSHPEEQTAPTPPPQKTPKTYDPSGVVPVHTLKDDLQEIVRDKKISVVHAAALEADKKRERPATIETARPSGRVRGMLFSIVILVLLGCAALGAVWYIQTSRTAIQTDTQLPSLLFSEQTFSFSLSGPTPKRESPSPREIKARIAANKGSAGLTLGAIARVVPTLTIQNPDDTTSDRPATVSEFFSAIGAGAPDELVRALSDNFFFGIHTVDKNAAVFVFEVTSYEHAFAGMLSWEQGIDTGLSPIVGIAPSTITTASGSTTPNGFIDLVMRNYDVRALRDSTGNVVLYYSFPTRNLLIIAESPYSFAEILARLRAGRHL